MVVKIREFRLVLMKELLAENGSIYVHLDENVGHYVKVMMDEIFGYSNFVNQIIWRKTNSPKSQSVGFGNQHDMIFIYAKNPAVLEVKPIYRTPDKDYLKSFNYNDNDGKGYYQTTALTAGGIQRTAGRKVFEFHGIKAPWLYSLENLEKFWQDGRIYKTKSGMYRLKVYLKDMPGQIVSDLWVDKEVNPLQGQSSEALGFDTQKPENLLKRIILASSNPGEIIADFFCGSGTTLAVAEKLGRRWIGSDLSKYAIQVTRKRLLDIHNSKDLVDEKKDKYGKPARPFELWNIGNYELAYWKENPQDYLSFMTKLYEAKPLNGFRYIHATKGQRAVHIGSSNSPVSMDKIRNFISECISNNFDKADVLGWEWNYEVNELAKKIAEKEGLELRLIQVPNVNELKSALAGTNFDLKLLKIPDQVIEKNLIPSIKFNELAYLCISNGISRKEITLKIEDFNLKPSPDVLDALKNLKDTRQLIDYWAIDWDFKGDTFHNQWQSYRTKKDLKVEYEAKNKYEESGEYQIMVKVVDVFGNDTNKILKVKI